MSEIVLVIGAWLAGLLLPALASLIGLGTLVRAVLGLYRVYLKLPERSATISATTDPSGWAKRDRIARALRRLFWSQLGVGIVLILLGVYVFLIDPIGIHADGAPDLSLLQARLLIVFVFGAVTFIVLELLVQGRWAAFEKAEAA
jgi:hypothetical protein